MDKKGLSGGLVNALTIGTISLIVMIIIGLIVVVTISDANLLQDTREAYTVTNETGGYLNATGYQLAGFDPITVVSGSPTITVAHNTSGAVIPSANYTVNGTGFVTNATVSTVTSANYSYSYTQKSTEEITSTSLSGNLSSGINNISAKIPTIFSVAIIVLILTIISIVFVVWKRSGLSAGNL